MEKHHKLIKNKRKKNKTFAKISFFNYDYFVQQTFFDSFLIFFIRFLYAYAYGPP